MHIGQHHFHQPIALAPMAGITDQPFRKQCLLYGADMVCSEMISAKPDLFTSRKSQLRLQHNSNALFIVQLLGNEPQNVANAVRYYADQGAQIIDLNMGCPAKKVCRTLAGSALMKYPNLIGEILDAAVSASPVPVTLKTRTGWDPAHKNIREIAQIAQSCGIQCLTIHGRTRQCAFRGEAEYDSIMGVKAAVDIPVIANGDIETAAKAQSVLQYTQADGIMIGRAAFGQPWLFRDIKHYLQYGDLPPPLSDEKKMLTIVEHFTDIYRLYGEKHGIKIARKHFSWYIHALSFYPQFRKTFNGLITAKQQLNFVQRIFAVDKEKGLAA